MKKNILVIAKHNKVEALRVAAGLTLMNDLVKVAVLGALDDSPAVREQLEALDFGEVPYEVFDDSTPVTEALARNLFSADVVYVI
ncbi:MAG TPA: hypothetical protein VEI74_14340 [Candidatus Methylomirabilis sp.]|nr:hypothetical protein [Candidatus Methylomirabilis sp.]